MAVVVDSARAYGVLGGRLSVALATGDTAAATHIRRELAVARALDALTRHLDGWDLTPADIARLTAAITPPQTTPDPSLGTGADVYRHNGDGELPR